MMSSMAQPSAFETRDAEIVAFPASEVAPARSLDLETVEYGSGWYHDAAIVAAEQAPPQQH